MSKKVAKTTSARGKTGSSSSDAPVEVHFKDFHAALDDLQEQLAAAANAKPGVKAIASLRTFLAEVKQKTRCQKGMTSTF